SIVASAPISATIGYVRTPPSVPVDRSALVCSRSRPTRRPTASAVARAMCVSYGSTGATMVRIATDVAAARAHQARATGGGVADQGAGGGRPAVPADRDRAAGGALADVVAGDGAVARHRGRLRHPRRHRLVPAVRRGPAGRARRRGDRDPRHP